MYSPQKRQRARGFETSNVKTLIAPVRGWNARDPEASMKQGYAVYLDNWWPSTVNVSLRKGAQNWRTALPGNVRSLMTWRSTTGAEKLFAGSNSGIYDASLEGVGGAPVAAATDGGWRHINFATTGGSFLIAVNGVDQLTRYDGTSWSTVASFPVNGGGTLLTPNISNINSFKRSLFFIEKDSMNFHFLPVDSIAGNVSRFPLGALFNKGGKLVAMATWTLDSGSGADDFALFITSAGQIAAYQGTDPSNANAWALRGVYDLGEPLGAKCFLKYGGDLLYLSRTGLFPMSKALRPDSVDPSFAITDNISNAFVQSAKLYGSNFGWQAISSFPDSMLLVNVPTTDQSKSLQYAMNTQNGAWTRFTDWDAFCWEIYNGNLFMGMAGKVARAWSQENDFGGPITAYAKSAFDYLTSRSRLKLVKMLKPIFRISNGVSVDLAIDVDFENRFNYGAATFNPVAGAVWGSSLWGVGQWAARNVMRLDWATVAVREGIAAAPRLRVIAKDATVEWTSTELTYEVGAIQG